MSRYLLFDDDGAFKAGTEMSNAGTSHQVELASGKRTKVKSSHVLLRFADPPPAQLIERAQAQSQSIDLDFLWEVAPQDEFGFVDLAREYFGAEPSAEQATALLFRLHGAPVYFYRKGRGRYRPAPAETLQAALAAIERRRKQDELRQQYVDRLKSGHAPDAIAEQAIVLLTRPDRNSIEFKALEQAANELHMTPLRLLLAGGAIVSPYRWHVDSFVTQNFPRGTGFAENLPAPDSAGELPLAPARAFSIDDSSTTEIDDAFSVQTSGDRTRIGIHIAAPALLLPRGHALDAIAESRMSTVYAPGLKYTMLPDPWIASLSLNEGREVPVLSLYADCDSETLDVVSTESRLERVHIESNLRHDRLDTIATDATIARAEFDSPYASQLSTLWHVACKLLARREQLRGRPEPVGRVDYSFELDGIGEQARVSIRQRRRGAPLDLIVAELMIFANSTWGAWLAQRRTAGIYRSQALGRVKMGTAPAPHEGIGVEYYAWCTSPLRRYVDLVNQRQLLACVLERAAPYEPNDAELLAIVTSFESAYGAYAEFQQKLEHYWSLRWLEQQNLSRIGATVLRGDVVRIDGLPFITRLPGLASLPRGQQLELDIIAADTVDLTIEARVHCVLAAQTTVEVDDEDLGAEGVEASAPDLAEGVAEAPVETGIEPSSVPSDGPPPTAS